MLQINITLRSGETGEHFISHKSKYVHIQENGDVYFIWKNDVPRLQTMDWTCDGTFRICRNSCFKQIYLIRQ